MSSIRIFLLVSHGIVIFFFAYSALNSVKYIKDNIQANEQKCEQMQEAKREKEAVCSKYGNI